MKHPERNIQRAPSTRSTRKLFSCGTIWKVLSMAVILVLLCSCSAGSRGKAPDKADEVWDPLESINRPIFWFNDKAFEYVLEPIAEGYDYITPEPVQTGIRNFFDNLKYPILLVSDVAQLKFEQAAVHTGRFLVNTTVGLAGLVDVAKTIDLEPHEEDFGVTMGYWGVSAGPYLVLPFLGPSNLRDVFGMAGEWFVDPLNYPYIFDDLSSWDSIYYTVGTGVPPRLDSLNRARPVVKRAKKASLDYYLFAQGAYHQMRLGLITDGASEKDPFEDEFDDEFDDEFEEDWEDEAAPDAVDSAE